jgi:hypothetical protein
MKIEIETPDPPEGFVIDGFRQSKPGERWWDGITWSKCFHQSTGVFLVAVKAKPLWEPSPELVAVLQSGWLARNRGGCWMWYKNRPRKNTELWGWVGNAHWVCVIRPELLPPDSIPWEQCCFKIGDPKE